MESLVKPVQILFVCMGNICRSPTAEGLFRQLAEESGLEQQLQIDSAGTHAYHIGEPPDSRAIQVAASRNIDLSKLAARQITKDDFLTFDYILAMDQSNLDTLARLSPTKSATTPRLLLEFGANCAATEIPDPYYSGIDSYEEVIALIEIGVVGLLKEIQKR